jgi:outer membrane biosynthesis protein TonB
MGSVAGSAAIDLEEGRRREFRRLLLVSAAIHAVFAALLAFSPGLPVIDAPAGVISVDLVAAPSAAAPAAARPKPKPAPAAKPVPAPPPPAAKPKPPVPDKRVLPKEATTPKPAPRAKQKELAPEDVAPPKAQEQDYADVLDQLRNEVGEDAPAPAAEPVAQAPAAAPAGGGGTGRPVSPEVADWMRRARVHIRRSWVVPPGFRQQSLATMVNVALDAQGNLIGDPEITKRSGNPWYDEGVLRSITKASPLPAPPEAGVWVFVLVSDENY